MRRATPWFWGAKTIFELHDVLLSLPSLAHGCVALCPRDRAHRPICLIG
jgi:hypothetical protein